MKGLWRDVGHVPTTSALVDPHSSAASGFDAQCLFVSRSILRVRSSRVRVLGEDTARSAGPMTHHTISPTPLRCHAQTRHRALLRSRALSLGGASFAGTSNYHRGRRQRVADFSTRQVGPCGERLADCPRRTLRFDIACQKAVGCVYGVFTFLGLGHGSAPLRGSLS